MTNRRLPFFALCALFVAAAACSTPVDPDASVADTGRADVATADRPDTGGGGDTGTVDTATSDAVIDTGAVDTGSPDTGTADSGSPDTGTVDSGTPDSGPVDGGSFTVGGNVAGLAGTGLVLVNGSDSLAVTASGAFVFTNPVAPGTPYAVTIMTQPSSPTQTCTVTNGTGTVGTANVTDVTVNCTTRSFTVGGSVTGLTGSGLILQNNLGDNLTVSASGAFTFATPLASGTSFAVTVLTQPSTPTQTCVVSGGTGMVGGSNVTSVVVNCAVNAFTVGGTVSGLAGTGLVLRNNGGDNLPITANGSFAFATPVASGTMFAVTVGTQPGSPAQTCVVSTGAGTVGAANVTTVVVACTTNRYTVGGTVSGLVGSGLVLRNNASDDLTVSANGSFVFATSVMAGSAYAVTIGTQPSLPTQTCTITAGTATGTVTAANVTSVVIACTTNSYTVGGTVSGLAGSGLVLQNNAGDNLTISASGVFTFATPVASGAAFAVTVLTQPSSPTQTCVVTGGTGTVAGSNVTGVIVNCAVNTFTVGGTISGLAGSGLVLRNNGGDALMVSTNGSFAFPTPLLSGTAYAVVVGTQPSSPSQTCVVTAGTGSVASSNVTSVLIACTTNTYTIGGMVGGLVGTGLVLQNNGGDDLPISANGAFTFVTRVPSSGTYAVTVPTQPGSPSQTCVVTNGSGSVVASNISGIVITCTTNTYSIGGVVNGLVGTGLVLRNNGGDNLSVTASGAFTFATRIDSGASFAVTVLGQPTTPTQTCVVTSGSGTVTSSNIISVTVTCTTNRYTIGGTVNGLTGTGLVLQNNAGDNLTIIGNGAFTFATSVISGGTFAVTVLTNPSAPAQTCTVSGGTGTIASSNATGVSVNCGVNTYSIGGTISGLTGSGLVLRNNGGDNLSVTTNGSFSFATPVSSGSMYAVTVLTQPGTPSQTCMVTTGSGTVASANITSVSIACTTNTYTVGGTLSGLAGSGLVLQNNAGDSLPIAMNGAFTFATRVASSGTYAVTVATQPNSPTQDCVVTAGSGTVSSANITSVSIVCTTRSFRIGGMVTGLVGSGLIVRNNGGDNLGVIGNGSFTFATSVASGAPYAVTVLTQPTGPSQTCVVTGGSGTVGGGDVTNVMIACTTTRYTVGGSVSGILGSGLVLQNNGGDNLTILANGSFTFATTVASG